MYTPFPQCLRSEERINEKSLIESDLLLLEEVYG